ncbi:hypothetical protein KC887_03830 [Candidatus Kaiserbacteria bacterium]|nr:hypothetical protein [Candidatus Kaiserbacteria bacterium]
MLSILQSDKAKPARKLAAKRQAIFVLDHGLYGRVVINRGVFARWFRRPANECGPNGDLLKTADVAMRRLLRGDLFSLEKKGMFALRGLRPQPLECTVFYVAVKYPALLQTLNADQFERLESHPLAGEIGLCLEHHEIPHRNRRRGLG